MIDDIDGYLIDEDSDGIYDLFHNNTSNEDIPVEQQDDGRYLIDEDGDGNWDYIYDPETNELEKYTGEPEEEDENTIWYAIAGLSVVLLGTIGLIFGRRKIYE